MWRSRRWRLLLNLIDHLPRDSYFVEALLDDDEFAEQLLNMPEAAPRERLSEWSPMREGLARIEDAIRFMDANQIAIASGKAPQVVPAVRPITAADRARHERRKSEHLSLVSRVLPGRSP